MENQHSGNLIPNSKRTPNELREIAKKGGVASGETRRKKKAIAEAYRMLAEGVLPDAVANEFGFDKGTETSIALAITNLRLALDGNIRAIETFRDTAGEKPVQEVESSIDVGMSDADRRLLEKVGARLGNNR